MSKNRKERALAPPTTDTPVNWSRLRQVFANLRSRRTPVFEDFVLAPVVVDATTPEEAEAHTNQAIVDSTRNDSEN
jgi:hypothetical protein